MDDIRLNLTYPLQTGDYAIGLPEQSDQPEHDAISGILIGILIPHVICTIVVAARIVSRLMCLRQWHLDDTLITVAWICSTAVCVIYSIASEVPAILDATIDPGGPLLPYLFRTYLGLIFYQLCLCLTKLSILVFYLRMFNNQTGRAWLCLATMVLVVAYGIPLFFMSIFQCYPIEAHMFDGTMQCVHIKPLLIASACLHTATDVWLIILVIPVINRLSLPSRQKVALSIVLSLSIFVIAASMIRLQLSLDRNFRPTHGLQGSNNMAFFVMTVLECDMALICASAPTIRPVLCRMWPRFMHEPLVGEETTDFTLTTVVSDYRYMWTEPATPTARSRSGSLADMRIKMPCPPVPTLSLPQRPLTPDSMKSMMSDGLVRSRGLLADPDKRPILVREEARVNHRADNVEFEGKEDQ